MMADTQSVAVVADRADVVGLGALAVEHPGAREAAAVAGEATGDRHATGQTGGEPGDEWRAVHAQAVGEHEHRAQRRVARFAQLLRDTFVLPPGAAR